MCHRILGQIDDDEGSVTAASLARKITLHDGIQLLHMAWEDVRPVSIRNCWGKAGLKTRTCEDEPMDAEEDIPIPHEAWDRWMAVDQDLPVTGPLTDDDIVAEVRASTSADDNNVVVDSDDSEEEESLPLPTRRQMEQALETLRRGLYGRGFNDFSVMNKVERAVAHVGTESVTQTKISRFFNVNGN